MVGNTSVFCLYTGEWSQHSPKCEAVNKVKNSVLSFVYIILPIFLVIVLFIVFKIKQRRKTSPDLQPEKIQADNILTQLPDKLEPLLPSELQLPTKRKQESTLSLDSLLSLKRNREFDAFVLYHFDSDDDFVIDKLLPELEETRDFNPLYSQ